MGSSKRARQARKRVAKNKKKSTTSIGGGLQPAAGPYALADDPVQAFLDDLDEEIDGERASIPKQVGRTINGSEEDDSIPADILHPVAQGVLVLAAACKVIGIRTEPWIQGSNGNVSVATVSEHIGYDPQDCYKWHGADHGLEAGKTTVNTAYGDIVKALQSHGPFPSESDRKYPGFDADTDDRLAIIDAVCRGDREALSSRLGERGELVDPEFGLEVPFAVAALRGDKGMLSLIAEYDLLGIREAIWPLVDMTVADKTAKQAVVKLVADTVT